VAEKYRISRYPSFLKISIVLAGLTLLGRFLGMLRESVIAAQLGLTELTDAVLLFLTLPDFLVSLLLIGGINSALIPALKSEQDSVGDKLLGNSIILSIIFAFGVGTWFIVSPNVPLSILAPSLNFDKVPNLQLGLNFFPLIFLFACFIALINAVLFSNNRFYIAPLTVALFNVMIILFFCFVDLSNFNIFWFSCWFLAAISLRLFLLSLPVVPFIKSVTFGTIKKQKKYWGVFTMGLMSFGTFAIAPTAFRSVYAIQGDGFLAIFSFANKLFEVPMGLIVGTITTILLPYASGLIAKGSDEYEEIFIEVLRATFALAVISLILTLLFIPFYVELFFEHGVLEKIDTQQISIATKTMFIGAPFAAISLILIVHLNANDSAEKIVFSLAPCLVISLFFAKAGNIYTFGLDQSIFALNLFYFLSCSCLMIHSFPKKKTLRSAINLMTLDVIPIITVAVPLLFVMETLEHIGLFTGIFLSIISAIGFCMIKWKLFERLAKFRV
jgi:putative peptidoglycan lipid II flippase